METIRPIPLCMDLDLAKPLVQDGLQEFELKSLTQEDLTNLVLCPTMEFQPATTDNNTSVS
jgi:hypothetical protein